MGRVQNPTIRWFKVVIFILIVAAVLKFLSSIGTLVRLVVIGSLLAYILEPLTRYLECRGLSRTMSTVVVFLGIVLMITVFVFMLLPNVTHEIKSFRSGFNTARAANIIKDIEAVFQDKFAFLGLRDFDLLQKLQSYMAEAGNRVLGYFLNAVSVATNLLIIPFIIFFLLKDGRTLKKQFISLVPNRYFELILNLIHKMDIQLGNYLRGQFLDSLIISLLTVIALWALKVKYFLIIGAFAGLANLVPFIGPIFGAVPAVLVALLDSGDLHRALYVALAFVVVQLVDNMVVKPVVVGRIVSMHPLMVLLVVIIGGKFFGVLGMLLSVPAYGIIKVVGQETVQNFRKYRLA